MSMGIRSVLLLGGFCIIGNLGEATPNAGQVDITEDASYLHATMQALFHSNYFRDFLKTPELAVEESSVVQELRAYIEALEESKETKRVVFSGAFKGVVSDFRERDAYAFFQKFLTQLKTNISNMHVRRDLENIFTTQIERKMFSAPKNVVSRQVISQQGISLKTQEGKGVDELLSHFCVQQKIPLIENNRLTFDPFSLNRYQKNEILRLPSVLVMHLDQEGDVLPQDVLSCELNLPDEGADSHKYKLMAVVMRNQEHYFTCAADNDQQWHVYDEHKVSLIKEIESINDRYAGSSPYLLFYERDSAEQVQKKSADFLSLGVIDTVKIAFHRLKSSLVACHQQLVSNFKA